MPKLKAYREKRDFKKTREPKPKRVTKKTNQRFCVQKHAARRLHYDFRLELDGVLVSFAIPKGPTMDPEEKRLAVHVEDHPLDYINFEGEIPKGNYGAGTVEIWDKGTYDADIQELRAGLKKGHLRFSLRGKKLHGAFSIVRTSRDDKNWLFFKVADDVVAQSKSLLKKSPMPTFFSPMLATSIDKPFDSPDFLFETKWDGYRALAFVNGSRVSLWSRNEKSLNKDYAMLVNELKKLKIKAILDGEIVALDDDGISRFELLQGWKSAQDRDLHFMIFDLLYVDGFDLRTLPLIERKSRLQDLFSQISSDLLHVAEFFDEEGIRVFHEAKNAGFEGIIAKRKNSAYVSARTSNWVKIKVAKREEFVVAGFTKPRGSREKFGSLLLGAFDDDKNLQFVGHVGTGFDHRSIDAVFNKMKPIIVEKCPFPTMPKTNEKATWIKPQLVAEISFTEKTSGGKLRQPVFHGLRDDKDAKDVFEDTQSFPTDASLVDVKLSHVEKIFWPDEGFTKGDMLAYYDVVAPFIIPHLDGRPLMLRRYPDGIDGADFVQKNINKPPSWLSTTNVDPTHKKDRQPIISDRQSLIYIANLAAIELHSMLARASDLEHPDFLVMDLDRQSLPFNKVIEVALAVKSLFDELGIVGFPKTSGGKGLHVYVPLHGDIPYAQSLSLAEVIGIVIREMLPKLVSLERMPAKRQRRVYVDYLQNAKGKSMIAPYSLRALPGAPVSTPLKWSEIKSSLDPLRFNILTVPRRLNKIGDIFADVLTKRIDLKKVLMRLEKKL